ncbi:MAG: tetratricopeptide repeat protein [Sphingobacteriales bacterium]|nr:tetratricopeptide repeat protein [Sphingobacteriales bacterium]
MRTLLTIFLFSVCLPAFSQQADKLIQKGNEYYKKKEFDKAESEYKKTITVEPSASAAKFNLGNALYKQNKPEEAIQQFGDAAGEAVKPELKSKAYYNKGVTLSSQKKPEESIESYKNALRQNPDDKEARENLQKALLELKKKNPSKPKQDDTKKKKQQQQQSMNSKEANQRLQLLAQKEKEIQQRMQNEKEKTGTSHSKDW